MNLNKRALGVAAAVAVMSGSAFAVSPYGNTNQKGSLLIFPLIDITGTRDTLIRITNDYSRSVSLKCFYQTTDPSNYRKKYRNDFTFDLTKTQPGHWWARSGSSTGDTNLPQRVRAFSPLTAAGPAGADGTVGYIKANRGELKCWAVDEERGTQVSHNHLVGSATVLDDESGQAFEYNAFSFQALPINGIPGTPVSTPGRLVLNGTVGNYDQVPKAALGNFTPVSGAFNGTNAGSIALGNWAYVFLAGGKQDLRQGGPAVVTKYTFTFWNQDESGYTGEHVCADSWLERSLGDFHSATYSLLRTDSAYYRIESVGDKRICGDDAEAVGMMGVQVQGVTRFDPVAEGGSAQVYGRDVFVRGAPLHGRGSTSGLITYDPPEGDGGGPPNN
jgi:hypothetical protein